MSLTLGFAGTAKASEAPSVATLVSISISPSPAVAYETSYEVLTVSPSSNVSQGITLDAGVLYLT